MLLLLEAEIWAGELRSAIRATHVPGTRAAHGCLDDLGDEIRH